MSENRFTVSVSRDAPRQNASFDLQAHTIKLTPDGSLEIRGEGPSTHLMPAGFWLSFTVSPKHGGAND